MSRPAARPEVGAAPLRLGRFPMWLSALLRRIGFGADPNEAHVSEVLLWWSSLDPPTWRGRMHAAMVLPATAAGAWLVTSTPGAAARAVVALYAFSVVAMFAVSAAFHLGRRGYTDWLRMRRWDHTAISVLIAGSYGAILGLGVPGWPRTWLLAAALGMCALGIALRWSLERPPYGLMMGIFIVTGAASLTAIVPICRELGALGTVIVFVGCGFFGFGAPLLGLRRPKLWPPRFGYHEVWHLNVTIAAGCQFWVVAYVVVPSL